ncbi:hypothetical protein PSPO01_03357 [Paraphaeosphaeria sporulosa]
MPHNSRKGSKSPTLVQLDNASVRHVMTSPEADEMLFANTTYLLPMTIRQFSRLGASFPMYNRARFHPDVTFPRPHDKLKALALALALGQKWAVSLQTLMQLGIPLSWLDSDSKGRQHPFSAVSET